MDREQARCVEGADEVDRNDPGEQTQIVRTIAPNHPGRTADAGAVDQNTRRPVGLPSGVQRSLNGAFVGDVARRENAAQFFGDLPAEVFVQIGDRYLRALGGEKTGRGRTQPRCAAGDKSGVSVDVHVGSPEVYVLALGLSQMAVFSSVRWPSTSANAGVGL